MKTPITYYGGKQLLLKELLPLIPKHRHYIEAFAGGAALFFAKAPSEAETINDMNGNITNFYRVTQNDFEALKKIVDGTLHSRSTYKEALTIYKNPEQHPPLNRAWAFWVCTNQGYSGKIGSWALAKDNKTGKTIAKKRERFTTDYAERLKHTQIENNDALKIINQYDAPDTFFYLDPPYNNSDCGHYKGYTAEDYKKLLELLSKVKGKFLLSSYPSEILTHYIKKQGWHYKEIKKKVNVNSKINKEKTEVLVWNYELENNATENYPPEKSNQQVTQLKVVNELSDAECQQLLEKNGETYSIKEAKKIKQLLNQLYQSDEEEQTKNTIKNTFLKN